MSQPALLNVALIAARIGASEIEFGVKKVHSLQIQKKGPTDYVTEMDQKIESKVFAEIKKYYPEHNFLGEEFGHEVNNSNTTWILDPIDGTTNFIHGYPHYCISLACKVDNKLEHAVIIDPARREEFTASKGKGAQLNALTNDGVKLFAIGTPLDWAQKANKERAISLLLKKGAKFAKELK